MDNILSNLIFCEVLLYVPIIGLVCQVNCYIKCGTLNQRTDSYVVLEKKMYIKVKNQDIYILVI